MSGPIWGPASPALTPLHGAASWVQVPGGCEDPAAREGEEAPACPYSHLLHRMENGTKFLMLWTILRVSTFQTDSILFKKGDSLLIFRFIISSRVTSRIELHVLMNQFYHTVQCCSSVTPLSKTLLAPPPEYPVCSDWSAHTPNWQLGINYANVLDDVLSQNHIIKKVRLQMRRFRSSVSCGRGGLLLVQTLTF